MKKLLFLLYIILPFVVSAYDHSLYDPSLIEKTKIIKNEDGSGDRYEGFYSLYKNIDEAFQLDFISAEIISDETISTSEMYNLIFFLQNPPANLEIFVFEPNKCYYMIPVHQEYKNQLNVFSWESKISAHNEVFLKDLRCCIIIPRNNSWENFSFTPVLFTSHFDAFPKKIIKYKFYFEANHDINISLDIIDKEENLFFSDIKREVPAGFSIIFTWEPAATHNNAKKPLEGEYFLVVKAQTINQEKEKLLSYSFYHKEEL